MRSDVRTAVHDEALRLEAYRFQGLARPFPAHFHACYVMGLLEGGERALRCKNQEYAIGRGHLLLFNPGDSHACAQSGPGTLDYRGLSLPQEVLLDWTAEITGRRELPGFSPGVVLDGEAARYLRSLHEAVMSIAPEPEREEKLLLLLEYLLRRYGQPFARRIPGCREEIRRACAFMEQHYAHRISLDQICRCAGLSKSTLLRAFAREKGVTPYRYLENIRIGEARRLLEQGVSPIEAALRTGFSDQSHFTNSFTRFLGLAPGNYRDIFPSSRKEAKQHGLAK